MARCATTALAGAVPRPCVRGARGRLGGLGPVPGVVSLPFPPSRPACPALRVAGCPVRVSRTLARWYAIPRGLCVPRARSSCPSGSPRVPFACVCARAPAASALPRLGGVACAPRAAPALGAGRAVRRGPCPSACPAPVPCSVWRAWGGAVRSRFPPTWLGAVRPPWGGSVAFVWGGLFGSVTHMLWAQACGCRGPSLPPWPACPVGAACRGGGGGPSPGGRPDTVAWGVWCQALSLPLPPVLWGGRPGSRDPCVPGAVGAGVGTQHRPHSVRPCGPALLAVGVAEGRPRGRCLPPLRGASEVRRSPSPDCPPTGRAVRVRHPRAVGAGVWVWGPHTGPLACMPCGGCVPGGWWGAVPGGAGLPPL